MFRNALVGAVAGATGTLALDIVTYADMSIRGRAASNMPQQLVDRLAKQVGINTSDTPSDMVKNRESGIGALLGYSDGLITGTLYGMLRPALRDVPAPIAGIGLGLAVMALTDAPMTAMQLTDPRQWGLSGWLSDLIPHLAYGMVTAWAVDAMRLR
ncbi:MAG TPA: hypothetical protein VKU87_08300 [Thermomicrobiaceae bacterium]|nr:hypothetical protein [Thermomicrobiaceae bacterium]